MSTQLVAIAVSRHRSFGNVARQDNDPVHLVTQTREVMNCRKSNKFVTEEQCRGIFG